MKKAIADAQEDTEFRLFDYPIGTIVKQASESERSLCLNDIIERDNTLKKLIRVSENAAAHVGNGCHCECHATTDLIVPSANEPSVIRFGISVAETYQSFMFGSLSGYMKTLCDDLATGPNFSQDAGNQSNKTTVSTIWKPVQELATVRAVKFPLVFPGRPPAEFKILPEAPRKKQVHEEFMGYVYCVDDHARDCRIQSEQSGEKGNRLNLSFKPKHRDTLLDCQRYHRRVRVKIHLRERLSKLDGEIRFVEPTREELV